MDSTQSSRRPDWWPDRVLEPARFPTRELALARPRAFRRDWPLVLPLATIAFILTFRLVASNSHIPPPIIEGAAIKALVAAVPYVAAAMAALAILRPWPGFLAILLLTPVWDAAQVSWYWGGPNGFQVILQTAFVLALGVGCLVSRRRPPASHSDPWPVSQPDKLALTDQLVPSGLQPIPDRPGGLRSGSTIRAVGAAALIGFIALALLSTYYSPSVSQSRLILAHGLLEPIAMGLILLGLRPGRRDLALVAIVLGVSAAIGCLINIVQTVPGSPTLALLQARRLYFSVLTYNNVGLLGELLSMVVPLIIGILLARRSFRLPRWMTALVFVALLACLAGMFLTFSKSAWLAAAVAATLLVLLAAPTWRSRTAIALAATVASAFVIPWPGLVLQSVPGLDNAYRTVMVQIEGKARFDSWNPATTSGGGSVLFRLRAAEAGLHMAVDHPILGVGLNQYHRYYMAGYAVAPASSRVNHAHSMWPELAAELGFPAMGLVALIYAAALLGLWRVYRDPPDRATRLLAVTFMAALTAWVVCATAFGTDIYRPERNMSSEVVVMAVVTAAAFALARYAGHTGGHAARTDR